MAARSRHEARSMELRRLGEQLRGAGRQLDERMRETSRQEPMSPRQGRSGAYEEQLSMKVQSRRSGDGLS